MIPAKRHELKKIFNAHFSIYQSMLQTRNASHKLLLFYAVECGLKLLILNKIKQDTTVAFSKHTELKGKLNGKNGHDIKYMLKYLGYTQVKLPELQCLNGLTASPSEYNQVWRYGISVDSGIENQIEAELCKIISWIERRI